MRNSMLNFFISCATADVHLRIMDMIYGFMESDVNEDEKVLGYTVNVKDTCKEHSTIVIKGGKKILQAFTLDGDKEPIFSGYEIKKDSEFL